MSGQTCSNFENESDDMAKANPPVHLTRELWLTKLARCSSFPLASSETDISPIVGSWDGHSS